MIAGALLASLFGVGLVQTTGIFAQENTSDEAPAPQPEGAPSPTESITAPSSELAPPAVAEPSPEPASSPDANSAPAPSARKLPDIEAKTFDVMAGKKSTSNRVYMIQLPGENGVLPKVGKILLFRKGTEPVMAFRVLKTYPAQKKFAAKRIRKYKGHDVLLDGDSFEAIEKLSDYIPPPPSAQDKSDLQELEKSLSSPAPEPVPEPSPAPPPKVPPAHPMR